MSKSEHQRSGSGTLGATQDLSRLNWENLKTFLVTAETGSFRRAAEVLGVSINTARRRVEELESYTGEKLLIRTSTGVAIRPEGEQLRRVVARVQDELSIIERKTPHQPAKRAGRVTVAVTEGIGTFWLTPRLIAFQRQHPGLKVKLFCGMEKPDLDSGKLDVSIQLEKPEDPDLIVTRLGTLHVMPYAAEAYLRENGRPTSLTEMLNFSMVEQQSDQVPSEMIKDFFPEADVENMVAMETNTSSSHVYAIAGGAGIGLLPTYARAISKRVVPVDIGFQLKRDIWLCFNRDVRNIFRVSMLIDMIKAAFDPIEYPWFAEEFVHPDDIDKFMKENSNIVYFEGYLEKR